MPTEVETIARGQNIITCNVKLHVVGPLLVIRLCSAIHFVYVCGNDRFVLIFVFFLVFLLLGLKSAYIPRPTGNILLEVLPFKISATRETKFVFSIFIQAVLK